MSLFFYYSNERSFLHRELTEMIYWALMYAWLLGALSAMLAGRHSLVPNVPDLKSFENVRINANSIPCILNPGESSLTRHPISEHCKFDILSLCLVAVT